MFDSDLWLSGGCRGVPDVRPFATAVPTAAKRPRGAPDGAGGGGLCGLVRRWCPAWCIACCIAATAAADASPQDAPGGAAAPTVGQPPEPDTRRLEDRALEAYLAARAWLDAEQLPRPDEDGARVPLPGVEAVAVLLRLDGRLVGAADAARGRISVEDAAAPEASEGDRMLRRALGVALAKALGDETIRSVRATIGDRVASRLSLEVEVAGPLRPLLGRTIAEAATRVDRGTDGLAVRRGGAVFRAFPSRLVATDGADRPDRTLLALIADAGLPAKDLPEFTADDRVSLARFATARMRGDLPKAAPSLVVRGGRLVAPEEATPAAARALAALLAARLSALVVARDPAQPAAGSVLLGPYQPVADMHDPPIATARESAYAALCLARIGRSTTLPEPTRVRAAAQAIALLAGLRTPAEPSGGEPDQAARDRTTRTAAIESLVALASADAGLAIDVRSRERLLAFVVQAESLSPTDAESRLLLAAALRSTGDPDDRGRALVLLDAALDAARDRPGTLVDAALPLALLARDVALATDDAARMARIREALDQVARVAASLQLRADGDPGGEQAGMLGLPRDLEGGLLLPGPRGAIPGTQCLRLAAALAIAEPVLDPAKAAERLAMSRAFLRFLIQHVADDPWAGGFRNPDALRGLVREALDRDDCAPAATAAGALFAVELNEAAVAGTESGNRPKP